MTGSISVQVFPYRRGLVRESSKTFHFFPRHFLLPGPHPQIEISILQGSYGKCFKSSSTSFSHRYDSKCSAQSRRCCISAANHRSPIAVDLRVELGRRRRESPLKSRRPAAV